MSTATKRRWDQAAEDASPSSSAPHASAIAGNASPPSKAARTDESKSASEAAAAAAAIAAKIAAQFSAAGAAGAVGGLPGAGVGGRDLHDAEFTHDIDINDVRNRYMLTKGSTQTQIHEETGASVSTKGVWYPDRSKATEKDPPLYLHISATSREILQKAIDKVNELLSIDLGSLVEDKKDRVKERRKWPEEKLPVGLETIRNFNVRAKVVGPTGMFVKYIQQETGTRVQIKGQGSGFVDQETGRESDEPMHIHITGPDDTQVARAKVLTEDLLSVVRSEHAKMQTVLHQQQMELHAAQAQYAQYAALGGYVPPPPSDAPPPAPGQHGQPPPPSDQQQQQHHSSAGQPQAGAQLAATDPAAFAAYWAQYGYDVNSAQFKEWAASQQQQYAQYYSALQQQQQGGYTGAPGVGDAAGAPAPAPAPATAPAPVAPAPPATPVLPPPPPPPAQAAPPPPPR